MVDAELESKQKPWGRNLRGGAVATQLYGRRMSGRAEVIETQLTRGLDEVVLVGVTPDAWPECARPRGDLRGLQRLRPGGARL